jgi:hypothetical protein
VTLAVALDIIPEEFIAPITALTGSAMTSLTTKSTNSLLSEPGRLAISSALSLAIRHGFFTG